jgi:tetratricopeptide (TPR) repeat protein
VFTLKPDLVLAERELERARYLFNQLDFHAAWRIGQECAKVLQDGHRLMGLAKAISIVGHAYDAWERFDWKAARKGLRKATNPREGIDLPCTDQLSANIAFLDAVISRPYGDERLYELYANARRRVQQGRYDDALARLYRAIEYLSQSRLHQLGIDTSNVDLKLLEGKISRDTVARLANQRGVGGQVKLGLRVAMELAAELQDQVAVKMISLYWRRQWVLECNCRQRTQARCRTS